ncbi:tetratricopeptide repeat protein [Heliomarina baculiformis]|uniref:tetratricopeptide repeat protein n=1 Tax=Heliomarina baculiformis TaxID=2872036 RepID=UPI001EE24B8C|nr:tetratricopeptide repeat protein [Heliomarina baculiformis]
MKDDVFGLPVSLETAEGLSAWNATQLGFLAHAASTPGDLAKVLEAEPHFALGHAVKGMFFLLLARAELTETAREALAEARQAAAAVSLSDREKLYIAALERWMDGSPSGAVDAMETVLAATPEDALAMKLSHAIRFTLGDAAGMRASVERVLPAYGADHAARGYMLGCHAFTLEETGAYEQAEITGRHALWTAPNDAWGLHAVAHVYDMTGRAQSGLKWLEGREAAWAHCNNFRYHVWWHKALMHLDQGDTDRVLALYDEQIRADKTDDYRDISNGASLLMRLELEGVDVGDRWEEMAEISAKRTQDGCLIFADLHYLMALMRGGDAGNGAAMLARIARDAKLGEGETAARMSAPGFDAAAGLTAFSEARFEVAFTHLERARDTLQLAGGSHAQRDVFERITIDAGLRAGYIDAVERLLCQRQIRRAGSEDAYTTSRRDLIAAARGGSGARTMPAQ